MYPDNTLTPKEATRLCALGTLAARPMRYAELATAVRHFVGHVLGPSIDLMGTSVELLKHEGLVKAIGEGAITGDSELSITDAGRAELHSLITANIRTAPTELNKLVVALKFRFLHLLEREEQKAQAELLVEVCENELTRLEDLRRHHGTDGGFLVGWLDHDIGLLEMRAAWLEDFRDTLSAQA